MNRSQATLTAADTDGAIGGPNTPKNTPPFAPTLQSISKTPLETPKPSKITALFNSLGKLPLSIAQRIEQSKTIMEPVTQQYTGTRPKTTIQNKNDWSINHHSDSCLCDSCYNPNRRNAQNVTVGDLNSILGDQQ